MTDVHRQMTAGIDDGVFPGAVLLAALGNDILYHRAYGVTDIFSKRPVRTDTVFDLASLTKPLATAAAVMKLTASGVMALETPVAAILTEFRHTDKQEITIAQLLMHTAGLPAYRPYYRALLRLPRSRRKPALRTMLIAQPLSHLPGITTEYSDLGYMILEWAIERASRRPLDVLLDEKVYGPLAVDRLFFPKNGGAAVCGSVAATEICPRRNLLLAGRVHDDNAGAVGGVAGHAGLFGTAGGIYRLLSEMLSVYHGDIPDGVFQKDLMRLFLSPSGRSKRFLAFDRPGKERSSAGRYFSDNTAGHLGFTGTSFWMDLNRRIIVILLTNRVHPFRGNLKIRAFRPLLHDAVMKMILGNEGCRLLSSGSKIDL